MRISHLAKTALALSFFRFIEASSGSIRIDGLDISKIKLKTLRDRLTILPQVSSLHSRRYLGIRRD